MLSDPFTYIIAGELAVVLLLLSLLAFCPKSQEPPTPELARAIIKMDDIAFSEGLGPTSISERLAWEDLVKMSADVAARKPNAWAITPTRGNDA